ncbi:MAG: sel1 repeat family protein [Desulfobulbus sp.]|nr:sel1 repeat family protein [Desulfobulbus sp.]
MPARQRLFTVLVLLLMMAEVFAAAEGLSDDITRRLKAQAYRAYYGKGEPVNHERALLLYEQAAERGDAEAQFIYGGMLYQGQGREAPDKHNGFKWLLKAAEQGKESPESLGIIGAMYLRGNAVPQNYMEAEKWLNKAAERGNAAAQNDLAYLYYHGLGGAPDYRKALELYEQAALQGDVVAQANTGLMYAAGVGTDRDRARGYAWYSLAASRGNTAASMNRNSLMLEMSWEELNRAQALSLELYRRVEHVAAPKMIAPEQED